jgi:very-short-patch-repair endonuclease
LPLTRLRFAKAPSPRKGGAREKESKEVQRAMRGPNRKSVPIERKLRNTQTDAERKLWFELRDRRLGGFKFVRQEAIGPFIVDFICRERKLIIEVDGGQHAESAKDAARDADLTREGYRVMRFWNNDVLGNLEGVLETILAALNEG